MKKWMKSPAVWGMVILFLVSAGTITYMAAEISRTHEELAELELQLSALEEEMDELREKAEAEDFAQKEETMPSETPAQETVKPQISQTGKPVQNKPVQPVSKYVSESKVKENILGDLQYDDNGVLEFDGGASIEVDLDGDRLEFLESSNNSLNWVFKGVVMERQ